MATARLILSAPAVAQVEVEEGALVKVVTAGVQGPPGIVARHEHVQASAAATWTVNHNLGVWPSAVTVLSPGGVEVNAEVVHVSVNQLTIHFAAPYAGRARIF